MHNWRATILEFFQEPLFHLLLVADPDGLLLDEEIILALQDKGIEILEYRDRAMFRYMFEQHYRDHLHAKYLLVHLGDQQFDDLPYDILKSGHPLELKIANLFPQFPAFILRQLDSYTLDALYTASRQVQGSLSRQETLDFILRKVYKLAYDTVDSLEEFIRLLVAKHESSLSIPRIVDDFLVNRFENASFLAQVPVRQWVMSKIHFYQYLQDEWDRFIHSLLHAHGVMKESPGDHFYHQQHPFHSNEMRFVLHRLFVEGKLEPVEHVDLRKLPEWTYPGITVDPLENRKKRVAALIQQIRARMHEKFSYKDWIEIMQLFAEAKHLQNKHSPNEGKLLTDEEQQTTWSLQSLEDDLQSKFESWMLHEYQALSNLPYVHGPVMVHHIPHFLRLQESKKKALLVLDGMNFVQWKQIRSFLTDVYHCAERGVFAWVPTVTAVSRQAIFSGEVPFYFADSLQTTNKEPSAWQLYWQHQGVSKLQISYEKGLGQGSYHRENIQALADENIKIAGIIIDTLDRFMHGAIQGQQGMQAEIDIWLQNGYLHQLIDDLLQAGFDVYLTSDHGNQESMGIGRINEGVLAQTRGERVRIYRDPSLRDQAAQVVPSIIWPNIGLPEDRLMLLAKSGQAFIHKGEQVVSHGGISIEEVIVPFVHITRKEDLQ